jgi:hypothetical protein
MLPKRNTPEGNAMPAHDDPDVQSAEHEQRDDQARLKELSPRRVRRRHRRILVLGILALVAGVVLFQLVPYGRDQSNPPVTGEPAWDSPATRALAVTACYDCHSNETRWPWYTRIAPISMMVYRDVVEGRKALNFSEWPPAAWDDEDTDRMAEVVGKGQMPLPYYLVLHPEAQLSDSQKGQLVNGLIATLSREANAGEEGSD